MPELDSRLAAFIIRCDATAKRMKIKRSTLSVKLFMDGKRLDALASGKSDVGIHRLAAAERELSALEGVAARSGSTAA